MFSIIVPVYNVEKYLIQCIDSLLCQTYSNIEIILVDDGSNDNSGKICDKYMQMDSRIKVIHKKNEGLGMARNSGLECATGKYVTFVDSDDFLKKDAIEKLIDAIKRYDADTVIGGYSRVDESGKCIFNDKFETRCYLGKEVQNILFPRLMGSAPNNKDSIRPSVWNAAYSISIIRENNLRFPSEREYIAEDIVFDIEYYRFSKKVALIDSISYMYRVTPGSLTQTYKPDRYKKIKYLYEYIFKRLDELNYEECVINRARRMFFVYVRMSLNQECTTKDINMVNAIKQINKVCRDELLKDTIKRYPIHLLELQPRIFLYFVKFKISLFLYFSLKIIGNSNEA